LFDTAPAAIGIAEAGAAVKAAPPDLRVAAARESNCFLI
jgi:hypothetical protein